jgi:hypothetical protein
MSITIDKNLAPLNLVNDQIHQENYGFAFVKSCFEDTNPIQQRGLFSAINFKKGDIITSFGAQYYIEKPTYLSVQVDTDKHIILQPDFLKYINHSCDPNVFFNTTTFQLESLKDIEKGDAFTFFYPSTEWEMTQSFNCWCGSPNCLGFIKGAKYVGNTIKKYKLNNHIINLLNINYH